MELVEVNQFIKQFDQMRMMMRGMSSLKGMFSHMGGGNMPNPHSKQGKQAMQKAMKMMRRFK